MGWKYLSREEEQVKKFKALPEEAREKLEAKNPRKKTTQRKEVSVDGEILEVLEEAKRFAQEWGSTLEKVNLECYTEQEYESTYARLDLTVDGLETDTQYYSRLWEEHERARIREEHDQREFDRLSKKFAKK